MQVDNYSICDDFDLERIAYLRRELANFSIYNESNNRTVSKPIPIPNTNSKRGKSSSSSDVIADVEVSTKYTNMCDKQEVKYNYSDSIEFDFADVFEY